MSVLDLVLYPDHPLTVKAEQRYLNDQRKYL